LLIISSAATTAEKPAQSLDEKARTTDLSSIVHFAVDIDAQVLLCVEAPE
jgi:hypothetical protein